MPKLALLLVLVAIAGLAALSYAPFRAQLLRLEYWTSDWRTALLSDRAKDTHSRIAIVLFNPHSAPGRSYLPIPRDYHARVLRAIDAAQPGIIGLDFYFIQGTEPDNDQVFIETLKSVKASLVVGAISAQLRQFTPEHFAYQKQFLADIGRPAGDLTLHFDQDNVTRHTHDAGGDAQFPETFARLIARLSGAQVVGLPGAIRIGWLLPPQGKPFPFQVVLAQDLLSDQPSARLLQEQLRGKIVLVGLDFPYFDRHRTPLSVSTAEGNLGVAIHAQMIAQLLDARIYRELPRPQMAAFLGGVLIVGLVLSWLFWTRANLLGQGVAAVALVSLDAAMFYWSRIYLPLAPALYVWFLAVLAGSNLRSLVQWLRTRRAYRRQPAMVG
jgi:adenylate cyclase